LTIAILAIIGRIPAKSKNIAKVTVRDFAHHAQFSLLFLT